MKLRFCVCFFLLSPQGGRGAGTWQHFLYPAVLQSWVLLRHNLKHTKGLPRWHSGKESTCQYRRHGFTPWVGKIPWSRKWQPIPVFLPGKFHGQRSLADHSPWGHRESDMGEHTCVCVCTHIHTGRESSFYLFRGICIVSISSILWILSVMLQYT